MPPLRIINKGETANLLALDGGGIKGISTLVIMQKIMDRVQEIENFDLDKPRKPAEYFDLAGGTSTGGIIALMLFRLNMSAKDAIEEYQIMGTSVFPKTSWVSRITKGTLFDDDKLLVAIDKVVEKHGPTPADKKNKGLSSLVDGKSRM
jgi:patatin-like phospholipase/acyl hydrolase